MSIAATLPRFAGTPRPFLRWPDARLRTPAAPVGDVTDDHRVLWSEMEAAMRAMPGVGLAAPQIGAMLRLAVVDAGDGPVYLADPRVVHASHRMRDHEEASPNLPGVSATISRPRAVTVAYTDAAGTAREREFVLLAATSVQHQIDHLDGRMYFHRLSRLRRDILLRKAARCA